MVARTFAIPLPPSLAKLAGVLTAVALLAGCAGASRISMVDHNTQYTPEMFTYTGMSGEVNTVIRGNPFGPGVGDPEAIAAVFPTPAWTQPRRFTTHPGPNTPSNYRLVLIFNSQISGPGGDQICQDPDSEPVSEGGGPIRMQAVFCTGERWASQLYATAPPAAGPNDPEFRNMLGHASMLLFPPRRPKFDADNNCAGMFC